MRANSLRESLPAKKNTFMSTVRGSQKSDVSPQRPTSENHESTLEPGLNHLMPAKKTRNRIPPPQRQRIIQKHIAGKSNVQIAREEGRNRESVARIVNGDEIQELVKRMRAEFYGLADDAIAAVRHTLQESNDGRVGYRLLADIGVIPSPAESPRNAIQAELPSQENLSPRERALGMDEFGRIDQLLLALGRIGEEAYEVYGMPAPTDQELWHMRSVAALIEEMTVGQTHRIGGSEGEWNRLRGLAEDILQGKRAITDKEIVEVRKKYND